MAPKLLTHRGAGALEPSEWTAPPNVEFGRATRRVGGKSHQVLDGRLLTTAIVPIPARELELGNAQLLSRSNKRSGDLPAASDGRISVSPGLSICGSASAIAVAWMMSLSLPKASRVQGPHGGAPA